MKKIGLTPIFYWKNEKCSVGISFNLTINIFQIPGRSYPDLGPPSRAESLGHPLDGVFAYLINLEEILTETTPNIVFVEEIVGKKSSRTNFFLGKSIIPLQPSYRYDFSASNAAK